MAGKLNIKLLRGLAGRPYRQRAVVWSLGLRKISDEVVQPDNDAVRGMVKKVRHLVAVTEVKEEV